MFPFNMRELNNLYSSYKEYIFELCIEWAFRIQEEVEVTREEIRKRRKTRIKVNQIKRRIRIIQRG